MSIKKQIRVRFAPSPTGFLHIGGLRTALYNYLFARQRGGAFILRIEDTDVKRKIAGATENLIKTLKQMGLDYDEGPKIIKGKIEEIGDYGPYIQSKRIKIYQKYAQELLKKGRAYYCFCSPKELEEMRQKQLAQGKAPIYDERCRKLSPQEIRRKIEKGLPYVIRLKIPKKGKVSFDDLIHGKVEFDYQYIDDQILLKSDGYPTYHLANVVDDHLMKISHVIRGEEWLSSTPKHIFLYQSFGWEIPKFAHLPLLLNPDKTKLSKRQGDVAVEDYLNKGYLPEALLNFIALLGWNPGDEREVFSLKELIQEFSLERVKKSGAIFNLEKLDWLNGYYIRKLSLDKLTQYCLPYLEKANLIKKISDSRFEIVETKEIVNIDFIKKIVALEQERLKKLSEIGELAKFFFISQPKYPGKLLIWKKTSKEQILKNLILAEKLIISLNKKSFTREILKEKLLKLAQKTGRGELLWPLRVALSGLKGSPGPFEIAEVLGKDKVLKRLKFAQNLLKNDEKK